MSGQFAITDTFLHAQTPLSPKTAVAAIILTEENKILLQLRDDKAEIFFPNHWGCFGGAIEAGETPYQGLIRELEEELAVLFPAETVAPFITLSFNPKADSPRVIDRYFFIVRVNAEALQQVKLGEGSAWAAFTFDDAMRLPNITPYDRLGLWLYFNQFRMTE